MHKWDARFLNLANHVAQWSKDPSTRVGSIIADSKNRVISLGYNGFPRGIDDTTARYLDRPTKLQFVMHAERNALDNAFVDVSGMTLYCTLKPCSECMKSIIQKGITRAVWIVPSHDREEYAWDVSETMIRESGIDFSEYTLDELANP